MNACLPAAGGCFRWLDPGCGGGGVRRGGPGIEVLEALGTLVDSSLVRRDLANRTQARFRMLETVREYALESLPGSAARSTN